MAELDVGILSAVDMQSDKDVVIDKLQQREERRLAEISHRREEKVSKSAHDESTKYFLDNFKKEKDSIVLQLQKCDKVEKSELRASFDGLSLSLQKLQKFLADSTIHLPSYEVRKAQNTIHGLQAEIQEKHEVLMPKKKFAFKSKKKIDSKTSNSESKSAFHIEKEGMEVDLADCKLVDLTDQSVLMESEEISQKDVALANLSNCKLRLFGLPSTVHINKLSNCTVLCGPVSTSIFITECEKCTFVLACQQLRIHTTTESKFYIHVTSRAIIEDSSRVEFGPYSLQYSNLSQHFEKSGLDKDRNNWQSVDDFNWLASDAHSPNWSIIAENDREEFN